MKYLWVFIGSFFFIAAQGQHTLAFYNDVMVNAMDGKHRAEAAKVFNSEFISELKKSGSFGNAYAELKWVSQKSDKDRKFRIFT